MEKPAFVPRLRQATYVYDSRYGLIASDAKMEGGPNIGTNGRNLSISFLSLNRAKLSERLLHSIVQHIPHFAGEVVITDNGSTATQLQYLKSICKTMPFSCRIIELEKNYGVAAGRNRAMQQIKTDWVMSLDNDIYFVRDPLPTIQNDLSWMGCHFMSLPLLDPDGKTVFARGGHLYLTIKDDKLYVGGGSACVQEPFDHPEAEGFLSTFLFGGAGILNRHTFAKAGSYDEAIFVGFEDIDFSVRLFQQGYKVGSTSICALIHDHPKPDTADDRDYEKKRFSQMVHEESGRYLHAKHGFHIWSEYVDNWLATRRKELGIEHEEPHDKTPHPKPPT